MDRPLWVGVELRHLAALAAVARERSFRGAAESLGYVQSAVSEQIAYLERGVGLRLVDRRRGVASVALTEAGELLVRHFDHVLTQLQAAQADVNALQEGRAGRLRIGASESVAVRLVPRILAVFARSLPDVKVELVESTTGDELAEGVQRGELDAAFGELPLTPGPFVQKELVRDPYVLLLPSDSLLARAAAPPSVEQLSSLDLIGHRHRRAQAQVEELLRARGIEPRIVMRSDLDRAVQAFVGAGLGAAVVPRLAVDESDTRVAALELGGLLPPRVVAIYWHADREIGLALEKFVRAATSGAVEAVTGAPLPLAA